MGYLYYGEGNSFAFEDRLLAHLRTVVLNKFGLQESLVFTWNDEGRQRSIWLHPTVAIHFEFDSDSPPAVNPAWIEQLTALANSPAGLRLIEEPPG